jgi:hypothetical protein
VSAGVAEESVDRRILGALRFVDAVTGLRVLNGFRVTLPEGMRGVRNLQGLFVLTAAPGQAAAASSLAQPAYDPGAAHTVEVTVRDPAGAYLARRAGLEMPRDPRPANAANANSVFRPVDVRLFPSPTARSAPGWATIRASIAGEGEGSVLGGALVRVKRASDGVLLSSGLSDPRGEALVAVPGIPVTTWNTGPGDVVATSVDVTLEVVWDPAAEGRLPDPDDLEARHGALTVRTAPATLSSGQVLTKTL